jgi:hypothetical protein
MEDLDPIQDRFSLEDPLSLQSFLSGLCLLIVHTSKSGVMVKEDGGVPVAFASNPSAHLSNQPRYRRFKRVD